MCLFGLLEPEARLRRDYGVKPGRETRKEKSRPWYRIVVIYRQIESIEIMRAVAREVIHRPGSLIALNFRPLA